MEVEDQEELPERIKREKEKVKMMNENAIKIKMI